MKTIRTMVLVTDSSGVPDIYICKIRCTLDEYNEGEHYSVAERQAEKKKYVMRYSFDEFDRAGKKIVGCFDWNTADEFTV